MSLKAEKTASYSFFFFFFFLFGHILLAGGILVPPSGMEPTPLAMAAGALTPGPPEKSQLFLLPPSSSSHVPFFWSGKMGLPVLEHWARWDAV